MIYLIDFIDYFIRIWGVSIKARSRHPLNSQGKTGSRSWEIAGSRQKIYLARMTRAAI